MRAEFSNDVGNHWNHQRFKNGIRDITRRYEKQLWRATLHEMRINEVGVFRYHDAIFLFGTENDFLIRSSF
jgi:hypothetical protein